MPTGDWLLMWVLNNHVIMSAKFVIPGSGVPLVSSGAAQTWDRPDFTAHEPFCSGMLTGMVYIAITSAVKFQFRLSFSELHDYLQLNRFRHHFIELNFGAPFF